MQIVLVVAVLSVAGLLPLRLQLPLVADKPVDNRLTVADTSVGTSCSSAVGTYVVGTASLPPVVAVTNQKHLL